MNEYGNIECIAISTNSQDEFEIILDGIDQKVKTPYILTNVSTGEHTVEFINLSIDEFASANCKIPITVYQEKTIIAQCETFTKTKGGSEGEPEGSLYIYTSPEINADIYIDDKSQGSKTPVTFNCLKIRQYKITIHFSGRTCTKHTTLTPFTTTSVLFEIPGCD